MNRLSTKIPRRIFHSSTKKNENMSPPFNPGKWPVALKTKNFGMDILHNPLWNKSMAFDLSERDRLGLRGLIPPGVRTLEDQVRRNINYIRSAPNDITKNHMLQQICDRNETLFHRLLVDHMEELAPIIYTPTVGEACQKFGHQFTRCRGMYFSTQDRGLFQTMMHNWPQDDIHVIVVTDGSRILGLGDLGAHGMGIPIGKLALYCAAGGIAPHRVLPVCLDVGTDNPALLSANNYIGLKHKRLQGDEYTDFLDEFMVAVFKRWPKVVVQFEDFETSKAIPLLERYRYRYRVFNDDIQGTGSTALAGVLSAARAINRSLVDLRVMCVGAGSAGLGVCEQIVRALVRQGLTEKEARDRFAVCTHEGVLGGLPGSKSTSHVNDSTAPWVNGALPNGASLVETAKLFKPHVLLGLSAAGPIFTKELIEAMISGGADRPIVFPLSNPTSKCEVTPQEVYEWSAGRAIVATGSPFSPVQLPAGADGVSRTLIPSQCNNMFVFPGLGLGASLASVTQVTDNMLYAAALACAEALTDAERAEGRVFPNINRIRDVSHAVGVAVIESAMEDGVATSISAAVLREGLPNFVRRKMYFPQYVPLVDPRRVH